MRTTDILGELQEGNRDHLDELISRYRPRLLEWVGPKVGSKLRRHMEAEDIIQEALGQFALDVEALCLKAHSGDDFTALMKRIILNRLADSDDRFRTLKRDRDREEHLSGAALQQLAGGFHDSSGVGSEVMAREEWRLLRVGIALLTRKLREAMHSYLRHFDTAEVATELQLESGTAAQRISRGIRIIRGLLSNLKSGDIRTALDQLEEEDPAEGSEGEDPAS